MSILTLTVVGGLALGCQPGVLETPMPGIPTPSSTLLPAEEHWTPSARPTGTPAASPTRPSATPGDVIPAGADKVVQLARADLARRLGLKGEEAITVTSVEAVDWPDTSLGCPQPGMMYAQMITPGYRVVLAAGGQHYQYHTDQGTKAVLCGTRSAGTPMPTVDLGAPQARLAADAARADLARRLSVDPATIVVAQVIAGDFPAQNLGCPPPEGAEPGPVQPAFVAGLELVLAAGGREYVYRAHGGTVVFCGPRE